jgi:hypothetical protein
MIATGIAPGVARKGLKLVFDLSVTAGLYSQVAGILAGFAFTAILLPLAIPRGNDDVTDVGHAITAFACAFFGLILAAIEYAVMAGEPGGQALRGRASVEELMIGAGFALSALLLLYGLYQLLIGHTAQHQELRQAGRVLILVVGIVGPIIVLGLLWTGTQDVASFRHFLEPDDVGWTEWSTHAIALVSVLLLCVVAVLYVCRVTSAAAKTKRDWIPLGVLVLAVVSTTILSLFTAVVDADYLLPLWVENLIFGVACAAVVAFAFGTVLSRGLDD